MTVKLALITLAVLASTCTALPPCVCTRNYRPVCGSDGQTYANQCMLDCRKTKDTELTMVKEGQCKNEDDEVRTPNCFCTYQYEPVCGTDGNTYGNPCALNCQTGSNPELKQRYTGVCQTDQVKVAEPTTPELSDPYKVNVVEQPKETFRKTVACTCTRDLTPVCGSDGVTYNNLCLLHCAGKDLKVKHEGSC